MPEPDLTASETAPVTVVVVPVKPLARAKSRLAPLPESRRRDLAGAFALDTVAVALATPGVLAVLVVSDDEDVADGLRSAHHDGHPEVRCVVVPDGVPGDLNATLVTAAEEAARRWPGCRTAALCADLPALRVDELARAVAAAAGLDRASYVRDARGTGTTMYAAPPGLFSPRFGPGSARAHAADGARDLADEIDGGLQGLRQDVDVAEDLDVVLALGVGDHTSRVVTPAH